MSRRALLSLGALLLLAACGQKGALYLPDKNAAVVTSPAAAPAAPPAPAASPTPKKPGDPDEDPPPPK